MQKMSRKRAARSVAWVGATGIPRTVTITAATGTIAVGTLADVLVKLHLIR